MAPSLKRIEAKGLKKRYGHSLALRGVDISLEAGKIHVLLGPNGAGKSTLLGILATHIKANQGGVTYLGEDNSSLEGASLRSCMGVLAHDSFLYSQLNAIENLEFWLKMYGGNSSNTKIKDQLKNVGLDEAAWAKPVVSYSRGMVQRLSLARALVHEPSFLCLDEPYTGLDSLGAKWLDSALQHLRDQGKMILLVTHRIENIDDWVDEATIIVSGKVAFQKHTAEFNGQALMEIYREHCG